MWISFLPFPTVVLITHLLTIDKQRTAVAFYIFGLLLPAVSWFLAWIYACSHHLIEAKLSPSFVRYLTRKYGLSILLYLIALLVSLVQPIIGLFIAVGLTLSYLRPTKPPIYIDLPNE